MLGAGAITALSLLKPKYMKPETSVFDEMKQKMRATWMAGDFGQIAQYTASAGEEFISRLAITPGMRILDVACGTGNLALPAARRGAEVTGIDIAPNLLEQARGRAAAENLHITFDEGDAEQLPYNDGSFDLVVTMFGAMFAPRPERVAAELMRVCKSGGLVGMASWTPHGFTGQTFALTARYVPPPEGIPSPGLWGVEAVARERLVPYASEVKATLRQLTFDYPYSPRQVVDFFRQNFGPTQIAFSRLDEKMQSLFAADIEALWRSHNQAAGNRTLVTSEYLEVIATRT